MASKVIEDLYTIRDRAAGARRTIPPCMAERWAEEYSKSGHAELQASTGAKNPDNYQLIGSTGCEELAVRHPYCRSSQTDNDSRSLIIHS